MIDQLHYPGVLLMETAGRKAAAHILEAYPDEDTFLILAGPGNNGGDGIVIARYLYHAGKQVDLIFSVSPENLTGDAAINFKALASSAIPWQVWPEKPVLKSKTPVLVDALLGTGIAQALRGPVAEMVTAYQSHPGPVVAIDIPSGLNVDTGVILSTPLQADLTLTFQLPKVAHATYPAARFCGEVVVADLDMWPQVIPELGIHRHWVTGDLVRSLLKARPEAGHKGTFGHALLVGGSQQYPGAIALSGHAAIHVGAGLSTVAAPEACRAALFGLGAEVIFHPCPDATISPAYLSDLLALSAGKSMGLGPGWSTHPDVKAFFKAFLAQLDRPVVLDADALNLLAEDQCWDLVPPGSVLTPHPGEMQRLLQSDSVPVDRLEAAETLAQQRQVIVVLKGAGTIIANSSTTWINPTGNPGMGTGGAGDVLTGMITGLMAQGYGSSTAALIATYLHGLAGDLAKSQFGEPGVTAGRILDCIGPAWNTVLKHEEPQIKTI